MKAKSVIKLLGTIGVWELFDRGIEFIINRIKGTKDQTEVSSVLTQAQSNVASVLALAAPVLEMLEDVSPECMRSNRELLKSSSLEGALNPHLNLENRIQLADRFFQASGGEEEIFSNAERAELLVRMFLECAEGSISNINGDDIDKSIEDTLKALEDLDPDASSATLALVDRVLRAYELVMGMYPDPYGDIARTIAEPGSEERAFGGDDTSYIKSNAKGAESSERSQVKGMNITAELLNDESLDLDFPKEDIFVDEFGKEETA